MRIRPKVAVVKLHRGTRVNPRHPGGAKRPTPHAIFYVVDVKGIGQMWLIRSDNGQWLGDWQPRSIVTLVNADSRSAHPRVTARIRGIVNVSSGQIYGNVPNLPMRTWDVVGIEH